MSDRWVSAKTRHTVALFAVVCLLVFAGCAGLGGDDTEVPPSEAYPDVYEGVTESADNETAASFESLVTDEGGELTDDGEQFLDLLETVDDLDTRAAVVESVTANEQLDDDVLESLELVLASPDLFTASVLDGDLDDTAGDGLLDGEAAALGLDPAEPDDRVVEVAHQYREGGYDERELAVLQRLAELDPFEWEQATELGLLAELTEGTLTAEDRHALEDDAGDGLLNGIAARLDLDTSQDREELVAVAQSLGDDAFTDRGLAYLERYAVVVEEEATYQQAQYLELVDDVAADGPTADDLDAIRDDAGDGLLNAMERELALDPAAEDPDIADVAETLAQDGYGDAEIAYLDRLIELREYRGHDYEYWAQAQQLGLLDEEIANGTVTDRQRWKLENNASNRLLNGMEVEFGTDPEMTDTSGDGYEDHLLWGPMQDLGLDVSPDSPNIFVEVDAAEGTQPPSDEQITAIQETFEEEPSEDIGPINVQFHICDTAQDDIVRFDDMVDIPTGVGDDVESDDISSRAAEKRNISGMGFQYLLLTDGLVAGGVRGFAPTQALMEIGEINSFAVVDGRIWREASEIEQAGTIAHELGHTLGIGGDAYVGVDSWEVPADEYDSVMNYNHPFDEVTFSTGEPFDDYEHMANQTFGSEYQDRSELEAMWDEGSADESVLC